jgi:hypothetical protein
MATLHEIGDCYRDEDDRDTQVDLLAARELHPREFVLSKPITSCSKSKLSSKPACLSFTNRQGRLSAENGLVRVVRASHTRDGNSSRSPRIAERMSALIRLISLLTKEFLEIFRSFSFV